MDKNRVNYVFCLIKYFNFIILINVAIATYAYLGLTWFRQVEESIDCSGMIALKDQMPINGNYNYALAY